MQADLPLFDGFEDALRAAVMALGGFKVAGPMLFPTKSIEAAAQLLRDSLNSARAEKLDGGQILFLLRAAREVGCYGPGQWWAAECGFDAKPVTRADEVDRVATVIESATKVLSTAVATMERLQRARVVA